VPQADPETAKAEIEDVIGIDAADAIPCSAKTGMGVDEIWKPSWPRFPHHAVCLTPPCAP